MNNHIPQLVDSFYAEFERTLTENDSMLFSGKFGSGKTYFLNHYFFELERNKAKYCIIYTQPSAYYHAVDGDVLGYLKYDILFELLRQSDLDKLQGVQLTYFETLLAMIRPEGADPADEMTILGGATMLLMLASVGGDLGAEKLTAIAQGDWKSSEILIKGLDWLKEKLKTANEDDTTRLEHYLEALSQQKNSLLEASAINDLIKALLKKQREAGKETILLVDDLDRMLPDACLGFLNMLSTHVRPAKMKLGFKGSKNLLSFEKVIAVGYTGNLFSFIRTSFGEKFDMSGYMNKVFSGVVFNYNPAVQLTEALDGAFLAPLRDRYSSSPDITRDVWDELQKTVFYTVQILTSAGVLNIREMFRFLKLDYQSILESPIPFQHESGYKLYSVLSPVGLSLNVLNVAFGDLESAKLYLPEVPVASVQNTSLHYLIGSLLCLQENPVVVDPPNSGKGNVDIVYQGYTYNVGINVTNSTGWFRLGNYRFASLGMQGASDFLSRHNLYELLRSVVLKFSNTNVSGLN